MRRRHGLGADPAVAAGAMTGSNSTTGGKDAMRRALTGAACVAALLAAGSAPALAGKANDTRSEGHTSELTPLMRISHAVFCLKNKKSQYNDIERQGV